ncbi:aminotransferase-like domain-containing protein [Pediococcus claussenii]|uniref:Multiple substrate aminotransferase n=1 Tax=Pediococcus claussenii (strain ATCC BAA-344 / DSM 14800 / JCM 18046 / KCTC 3811 / LMG 21948 / P06) TaxID=701521 RepID=G8PAL2_PEDCP|nr:PLP-dependent aminotransferase family protein [Pediococcus claussenii]AEV95801.1 multiple substrate aminotransferase [Pediococcus claussenii ATCC BAA-344]KRN20408.1 hypothetical protein IV79_GL000463 [Pediococcus claussenii]
MKLANRTKKTSNSGLDEIFAASGPGVISFAGGYPDQQLFPKQELEKAFSSSFQSSNSNLLQYNSSLGYLPLRDKLAQRLQDDGIVVNADSIMLTQGAQQGIDLAARLLLDKGDGIVVEAPTYLGALAAFDVYEPTYYEVSMDNDGMNIEALRKVLMSHQVKMIYTVPDFQNPTGTVMSLEKRKALIKLANDYDVVILEDGPYRNLRYKGESLPPIKHFDTQGRVIFLGSFSKILAPGLRLGWLTAGPELFSGLVALKGGSDVESSNLTMASVNVYLEENDLDEHIATVRSTYKRRKDVMIESLQHFLPSGVSYTNPDGGFFLWLTMPAGFDSTEFLKNNLIPNKVSFVPSANLMPSKKLKNAARLSFSNVSEEDIRSGIQTMSQLLSAKLISMKGIKKHVKQ